MTSSPRPSAREPKYYTVKRHLLASIDSLEAGSAVPTERDLAAELGTSRTTVRQALVELVSEGRLVRRQGSGTYVAEAKMTWPQDLAGFTEQAQANGMTPSSRLLESIRIRADEEVADRLALRRGAPVYQIDRLRLADDQPIAVESSLLSAERFPRLGTIMRTAGSLHTVLADVYDVRLRLGEESIEVAPASPEHAALLQTDTGSPLLVVKRRSFTQDKTPIEWGISWFRGDRITLVAKLAQRAQRAR